MATLKSEPFRGDPALEACATRDSAHITPGSAGPHVRKIQDALNRLEDAGIGSSEYEAARYGTATTLAVTAFKSKRRILNYAGQIDSIVGIKTIRALDEALLGLGRGLENALDTTPYVDVIVNFVGGSPRNGPDDAIFRLQKPAGYDARGRRLVGLGIGANVDLPNPVRSTVYAIQTLQRTAPIGLLCIRGSSLGGLYALELAEILTTQGMPIRFVSLQDAAFSPADAVNHPIRTLQGTVTNVPMFRGRTVRAEIKVSHFQTVGNKAVESYSKNVYVWGSDLNGEVHGEVRGFLSRRWTVPDDYHRDNARNAHGYCCAQAEVEDARTISRLLQEECA
jgi:hypothetical protein